MDKCERPSFLCTDQRKEFGFYLFTLSKRSCLLPMKGPTFCVYVLGKWATTGGVGESEKVQVKSAPLNCFTTHSQMHAHISRLRKLLTMEKVQGNKKKRIFSVGHIRFYCEQLLNEIFTKNNTAVWTIIMKRLKQCVENNQQCPEKEIL